MTDKPIDLEKLANALMEYFNYQRCVSEAEDEIIAKAANAYLASQSATKCYSACADNCGGGSCDYISGQRVTEISGVDVQELLLSCASILDVVKSEWGKSWSNFDQSVRDRISKILMHLHNSPAVTAPQGTQTDGENK